MASGRTCVGASWSAARTFNPTETSVALTKLTSGRCYRYTIDITADGYATASVRSGPLLITNGPPPCAHGDVATTVTDYTSWKVSLLDTTSKFSSAYVPSGLVSTSGITSMRSGFLLRSLAKTDFKAMADAARAAGATLNIQSSYRSYSTQSTTCNDWVAKSGMYAALPASARPGYSEHQLGTAIDFKSYGGMEPWRYADWATTKAGTGWPRTPGSTADHLPEDSQPVRYLLPIVGVPRLVLRADPGQDDSTPRASRHASTSWPHGSLRAGGVSAGPYGLVKFPGEDETG